MGCQSTYLVEDGTESILYKELIERYGPLQGEVMYLNTKRYKWDGKVLNFQGEPSLNTLLTTPNINSIAQFQKRTEKSVVDNIISTARNVEFDVAEHTYKVNGEELNSVSRRTDRYVRYTGSKTDFNYSEEGNKYHAVFEKIVQGASVSEINNEIPLTDADKILVGQVQAMVKELGKRGTLIPEIRMANKEQGIAGTIDLLLVKPDGKAEVYDLKTVFMTPKRAKSGKASPWNIYETSDNIPNYKAKRYGLQTTYYKHLVESSDPDTGRQGIEVDEVYVIPIAFYGNEGDWTSITLQSPENIDNWRADDVNFARWADKIVASEFADEKPEMVIKGASHVNDITTFVDNVIGDAPMSENRLTMIATKIVLNTKKESKFIYKGVEYNYKSEGKLKRIAEVKAVMASTTNKGDSNLVSNAINTLRNKEAEGIFAKDEEAYLQLKQMYNFYMPKKVYALSDIEGYEGYDDIMVFERASGTIELLKLTKDSLTYTIPVTNKNMYDVMPALGTKSSIAGNHIKHEQALSAGITLQNTREDKEKLKLAMIAMKLKETNPELSIDRLMIHTISGSTKTLPTHVWLEDIIPQVKAIADLPSVKKITSPVMQRFIGNEKLLEAKAYKPNVASELFNYFDAVLMDDDLYTKGKPNVKFYMKNKLASYIKGDVTKQDLINFLTSREFGLRKILADKYSHLSQTDAQRAIDADPEFGLLSRVVISLQEDHFYPEKDINDEMFGKITKWGSSPTKTGRKTLDLAIDYGRRFVDKVKRRLHEFSEAKGKVMERLRKDAGGTHAGPTIGDKAINADMVVAMGTDAFIPLIQKRTSPDGTSYYVPFLIEEGSTEFRNLSKAQQDTIKWLNDEFENIYKEAHPGIEGKENKTWVRGFIPVLQSSPNDYMYKAKSAARRGEASKAARFTAKATVRGYDASTGRYEYQDPSKFNKKQKMLDIFTDQITYEGVSPEALLQMGLDENLNLVDPEANDTFQLDLDSTVTSFASHYFRYSEYNKAIPVIRMFKSLFSTYESGYFLNQKGVVDMLDKWVNDVFFGEKAITVESLDKAVSVMGRVATTAMLGLNWVNITQNNLQSITQIIARAITSNMGASPLFPKFGTFMKASKELSKAIIDPDHASFLSMLMDKYMPEDITTLQSKAYKPLQTGLVNADTAFALDRMSERALRTMYLVAQMMHDGTYEAHSLKKGKDSEGNTTFTLVYNETADERFTKDRKLKDTIKSALHSNGEGLDRDGNMTMAYDWRLRQRMKNYADLMIPSNDKDLAVHIQHFGFLNGTAGLRAWFREHFTKVIRKDYDALVTGDYIMTKDGYIWSDDVYKGIWHSIIDLPRNLIRLKNERSWSALPRADRENYIYSAHSMLMWTSLSVAMRGLFDDEDEHGVLEHMFARTQQDLLSTMTLGPMYGVIDDPFIFISFYKRVFNTFIRALEYSIDGEADKSWDAIKKITPVVKDFHF